MLEVGMKIYTEGLGLQRYTITRTTPKFAFVKINERAEMKFKRDVGDGTCFKKFGEATSPWVSSSYSVETPKLKQLFRRQGLENRVNGISTKNLSDDQLERIVKILGEEVEE